MIANTKCQHCGNVFETDGMNRTEFCPHCGKETSILAQVAVPALGVPQSHRLRAKIMRPLILFILLPVAIVGVICYGMRQNKIAQASTQAEKWKQQHTLTPSEENEVLEKLAARAARSDLELWEINHPDWKTGNALIDADTEQTHSNSFYYDELEKIKQIPTSN